MRLKERLREIEGVELATSIKTCVLEIPAEAQAGQKSLTLTGDHILCLCKGVCDIVLA